MPFDSAPSYLQLLTFAVPGLPDLSLAVSLSEVFESTRFTTFTPLPFTPPAILGLCEWHDHIITVIDLACLLSGDSTPLELASWRGLVAQVILNNRQLDHIAWPILPGARLHPAPLQALRMDLPGFLNPGFIRASIQLDNQAVILLNLDNLAGYLTASP